MSQALVAVDWGTSSLRAARVSGEGRVLEERTGGPGILAVAPGGFPDALKAFCGDWLAGGAQCLISGMAGSRQGWVEAPYCACPASAEDLASNLRWVEAGRVAIVPGMSCEDQGVPDVMRGEETQVFGALELCSLQDATVVLPGTHSKWVQVRRGRIQHFTTFMTGEFYALLKTHSILARTLPKEEPAFHRDAFLDGVAHAQRRSGLLHSAFSVRTLSLFDRTDTAGMHSYLSGLVIGDELRGFDRAAHVVLVGARELTNRYALALGTLGVESTPIASEATWHGLWRLSQNIGHRA